MLTIVYITCRLEPRLDLFFDSVSRQLEHTDQVVIVDHWMDYIPLRTSEVAQLNGGRFDYLHTAPKPSIWRGNHKKTKVDFADTSGARNTGLIVAEREHVVFFDDLTALHENCLSYHRDAANRKVIFNGRYESSRSVYVDCRGKLGRRECILRDSRSDLQPSHEEINGSRGTLWGSNMSIPMEYMLRVNGYDEICARKGAEDSNLGARLHNAGYENQFKYNKHCLAYEEGWSHYHGGNSCNWDSIRDKTPLRMFKSDQTENIAKGPQILSEISKLEYEAFFQKANYLPLDPHFDLKTERTLWRETGKFKPVDLIDFTDYDKQHISEI